MSKEQKNPIQREIGCVRRRRPYLSVQQRRRRRRRIFCGWFLSILAICVAYGVMGDSNSSTTTTTPTATTSPQPTTVYVHHHTHHFDETIDPTYNSLINLYNEARAEQKPMSKGDFMMLTSKFLCILRK